MASARLEFAKYHGLGNDFILVILPPAAWVFALYLDSISDACLMLAQVDNRHQAEPLVTAEQAKLLCDRNFGIGGDGVRASSDHPSPCPAQHPQISLFPPVTLLLGLVG